MIEIRDRLTQRLTKTRVSLELRRSVSPMLVIVVGAVVAFGCAAYIVKNVAKGLYTPKQEISFVVDDASGVIGGGRQELRFKGIKAGAIDDIELRDKNTAVITAHLYKDFGPVYRDATITLRPVTALEDMTVDILDRGTESAGRATKDEPVLAENSDTSVVAEDVLNAFDPDVRTHMATVLRNLGGGLEGRGEALREAFVKVEPFVQVAARLTGQLQRNDRLTRQLIHDTGTLTDILGDRDAELTRLVQTGGATLRTLEAGSPDLAATLEQLPPTLSRVDSSFAALRTLLPTLDDAVEKLNPTAERLPAGLTAVRNLTKVAEPAVKDLQRPVQRLVPLSRSLRPLASGINLSALRLRPQVAAIDKATKILANCSVALQGFFQWTPSVAKFDGAVGGTTARGDFNASLDTLGSVSDPNVYAPESCTGTKPLGAEPTSDGGFKP